jgi:superfamily I DNA and/or RNA helicase
VHAIGLDVTMFQRLSVAFPWAVTPLARQYRMNADVCELSNVLVYSNTLRCGSKVASFAY